MAKKRTVVQAPKPSLAARVAALEKDAHSLQEAFARYQAVQEVKEVKSHLAHMLEAGTMARVTHVDTHSIICGREYNVAGELQFPGHIQVAYSQVRPELQPAILGRAVGDKISLPNGNTLEITLVCDPVAEGPTQMATAAPSCAE